jgi:hypothetical protein
MNPPPGIPRWGAAYRDFLAKYYARHASMVAQTENLPYADQTIDLDPNVRDQWGLPAPRLTYDSAPALCQLHPCEHRRECWIGDQRQEPPVLSLPSLPDALDAFVMMDNLPAHKVAGVREASEPTGATLPPLINYRGSF